MRFGIEEFCRRAPRGEPLALQAHAGVIDYDPQELVLTARAGTPLRHIEAELGRCGQYLAFEPPHFGAAATLGGAVACGLAGPARASVWPVRDFVLGVRVLTGDGQLLQFGGRVMKNVAGYDVTRLMVGAFGTLGVLLDISLKVLPRPPGQLTLTFETDCGPRRSERMNDWALTSLPISASSWVDGRLYFRVQGSSAALTHARRRMGGEETRGRCGVLDECARTNAFRFSTALPVCGGCIVPAESALFDVPGRTLIEWTGTQRWIVPDDPRVDLTDESARAQGFATRFRAPDRESEVFPALPAALRRVHRELKKTFDPHGILNPGRLYADL